MTRTRDGGIVLLPGEARRIELGGSEVVVHADSADTGASFSLIETGERVVEAGPPLHIHRDSAEAFFVLAGRYAMHLGDDEFECPAGSYVYVPKGMVHTFRTLDAGSRKLNLYTPAAMVGYFDGLAAGIAAGMDEADLDALAERFEMDVVGPVPEGYL
jgi:mannose-6-phosphate isomerase-like protein (cupin superfamily)